MQNNVKHIDNRLTKEFNALILIKLMDYGMYSLISGKTFCLSYKSLCRYLNISGSKDVVPSFHSPALPLDSFDITILILLI